MELAGWDRETSPFHSGEQELQDRLGIKVSNSYWYQKLDGPCRHGGHLTRSLNGDASRGSYRRKMVVKKP